MTDKKQPEALRLANVCSNLTRYSMDAHLIAAELRRLHAESEMRRAALLDEMQKAAQLDAELETLNLYKNIADEYGLYIFPDIAEMTTELETLRAKLKTYEDLGDAGSDVQLLRMGYAAARLEIESLQNKLKAVEREPFAPTQSSHGAIESEKGSTDVRQSR